MAHRDATRDEDTPPNRLGEKNKAAMKQTTDSTRPAASKKPSTMPSKLKGLSKPGVSPASDGASSARSGDYRSQTRETPGKEGARSVNKESPMKTPGRSHSPTLNKPEHKSARASPTKPGRPTKKTRSQGSRPSPKFVDPSSLVRSRGTPSPKSAGSLPENPAASRKSASARHSLISVIPVTSRQSAISTQAHTINSMTRVGASSSHLSSHRKQRPVGRTQATEEEELQKNRNAAVIKFVVFSLAIVAIAAILAMAIRRILFGISTRSTLNSSTNTPSDNPRRAIQQDAISSCEDGECAGPYGLLFQDSVDTQVCPCSNFYRYACGGRRITSSTANTAWRRFARNLINQFARNNPAMRSMVEPVREAALFLETCLHAGLSGETGTPLKNDVKAVLAEAGLTWPGKSEHSDVLMSLFFMARRVALPVFFGIDVGYKAEKVSDILFPLDVNFQETLRSFRKRMMTRHGEELVRQAYKVFEDGHPVQEPRLAEILEGLESMTSVFDIYLESTDRREPIENLSSLPLYAPSVSLERWSTVIQLYLKLDFRDINMATLYDIRSFSAIFRFLHIHGETRTNDIFGFLAIMAAIFYTDSTLRDSFIGPSEDDFSRHQEYCLLRSYSFYGHALNNFLLASALRQLRDVSELVKTVQGKFRELVRLNNSFTGDPFRSPSDHNLQSALYFVTQSEAKIIARRYKSYPRVSSSALHNWMNLVDHVRGAKLLLDDFAFNSSSMNDCAGQCDVEFFKWRLTPYHLAFPWYAPNVHRGILLSGLGTRLAAAVFMDYVDRSGSRRDLLYKENHDCLRAANPELEASPDLAIQAGVAAVRVTSALLNEDASKITLSGSPAGIGHLTAHQVFFVLGCNLLCGYHHGESLCNVPLRHNVDFSRVFNCSAGSYMNPIAKCRLRV